MERSEHKLLAELTPIATRKFGTNFRSVLLSGFNSHKLKVEKLKKMDLSRSFHSLDKSSAH